MDDLAQVLADERGQAATLRAKGFAREADIADGILDRVKAAAEDYLTWLGEGDAELWSGLRPRTLRRRFRELLDARNARYNDRGQREYRAAALPRRANLAAVREAARRGLRMPAA